MKEYKIVKKNNGPQVYILYAKPSDMKTLMDYLKTFNRQNVLLDAFPKYDFRRYDDPHPITSEYQFVRAKVKLEEITMTSLVVNVKKVVGPIEWPIASDPSKFTNGSDISV